MRASTVTFSLTLTFVAGGILWISSRDSPDERSLVDRYLASEREESKKALSSDGSSSFAWPWSPRISPENLREQILGAVPSDRLIDLVRDYKSIDDRDGAALLAWESVPLNQKPRAFQALLPLVGDGMKRVLVNDWIRSLRGTSHPALERWISERAQAEDLLGISRIGKPSWRTLLSHMGFKRSVEDAQRRLTTSGDPVERKKNQRIMSWLP